jgi:hypothetical protein
VSDLSAAWTERSLAGLVRGDSLEPPPVWPVADGLHAGDVPVGVKRRLSKPARIMYIELAHQVSSSIEAKTMCQSTLWAASVS